MPFTPYHVGPGGVIGLVFRRWIDLPVFILSNVVIDIEPLIVLSFGLNCRTHGYCHTLLFGTALAVLWAFLAWRIRSLLGLLMRLFALPYETTLRKMIISAVLGVWFHIFLDALCWEDIRPFWPLEANPLLGHISVSNVYLLCTVSFIPAIILYVIAVVSNISRKH